MSIIVQNMAAQADIRVTGNALGICFDDPAYIRSERVVVQRDSGAIGVVFEQGFHLIGQLPAGADASVLREAHLSGVRHALNLRAPVRVNER